MYVLIPKEYITPEIAQDYSVVTLDSDHDKVIESVPVIDGMGQSQEVAVKWITFKLCEKTNWNQTDEDNLLAIVEAWNAIHNSDQMMQLNINDIRGDVVSISQYLEKELEVSPYQTIEI